jgi:hypothetical protein
MRRGIRLGAGNDELRASRGAQASKRGIHNAASAGSRGTKQKSSGRAGVPGRRNGAVRAAASAGARGAGAPKSGQ